MLVDSPIQLTSGAVNPHRNSPVLAGDETHFRKARHFSDERIDQPPRLMADVPIDQQANDRQRNQGTNFQVGC
jgi:hypothetical protein